MPEIQETVEPRTQRSAAHRAQRLLKDADRLLKASEGRPPHEMAMAQLEQAKVWALLQLGEDIREARRD